MKKTTLGIISLSLSLFAAGALAADSAANKNAPATPAQKQQKLVRVSTLNTIEANQEFQTNVQLVQTQRQQAIEMNAAMDKETGFRPFS